MWGAYVKEGGWAGAGTWPSIQSWRSNIKSFAEVKVFFLANCLFSKRPKIWGEAWQKKTRDKQNRYVLILNWTRLPLRKLHGQGYCQPRMHQVFLKEKSFIALSQNYIVHIKCFSKLESSGWQKFQCQGHGWNAPSKWFHCHDHYNHRQEHRDHHHDLHESYYSDHDQGHAWNAPGKWCLLSLFLFQMQCNNCNLLVDRFASSSTARNNHEAKFQT